MDKVKDPNGNIARSPDMLIAGYFLSRCGNKPNGGRTLRSAYGPPEVLGVETWKEAYELFFDSMGDGRSVEAFRSSMQKVRDRFDTLFNNGRAGWLDSNGQRPPLRNNFAQVHETWKKRSDEELEAYVRRLLAVDGGGGTFPSTSSMAITEGGERVYASRRRERSKKLRKEAISIHGLDCMACGFSFEEVYGSLGEDFIEVHHVIPLSEAGRVQTDPRKDLVVLCANCHRMVHRKRGVCLSLDELKQHLQYKPTDVAYGHSLAKRPI